MVRRVLLAFFRLVLRVFFARVQTEGRARVPAGPLVLVANHPNSLLDPLLVATTSPRPLAFAAKDVLFDVPVLGWIIRTCGGVPIRRPQDHGARGLDNGAAFDALVGVLRGGGAFAIFPEGLSHDGPDLAPLKTGAARVALRARDEGAPVRVQPVGLTYATRDRMRGRVLVHYGAPIDVPAGGPEPDAVEALTARIDEALRSVTLNAPDWETARALAALRGAADAPTGDDLLLAAERGRTVTELLLHRRGEPAVDALIARARGLAEALDGLELDGDALGRGLSRREAAASVLGQALLVALWLPLALPGALLHAPAIVAGAVFGRGLSPRTDVVATTKMMVVTSLVLLAYVVVALVVALGLPFPRGVVAAAWGVLALTLSGWATVRVLERQSVLRRGLRHLAHLVRWRRWLLFLQEERAALRADLLRLAADPGPPAPAGGGTVGAPAAGPLGSRR